MTAISFTWWSNIKEYINENSDPHTKDWPFMESPMPFIVLSICYLYIVCIAGPRYMKDRKPYNLKTAISIYNTFQIVSCAYLIYSLAESGFLNPFKCQVVDNPMGPKSFIIARLVWWTTMLKLTEYIETVFFVLRKKQNQVSGLHLYHHVSTLLFGWLVSKFGPVQAAAPPIAINSFVHVLMYSYYLIALHGGKELQKKLVFWKRSLTILQMVQFTVMIAYTLFEFTSSCSAPTFLLNIMLLNVGINYFMFFKFYKKTYNKIKGL